MFYNIHNMFHKATNRIEKIESRSTFYLIPIDLPLGPSNSQRVSKSSSLSNEDVGSLQFFFYPPARIFFPSPSEQRQVDVPIVCIADQPFRQATTTVSIETCPGGKSKRPSLHPYQFSSSACVPFHSLPE